MVIEQGEVFWIELGEPDGSEPAYLHPHVVIQNNIFNLSKINTVAVCGITSNLKRGKSPGNVTLRKGEANLPKKSVVNISQLLTVNKYDLNNKVGTLSKDRMIQIVDGINLLIKPANLTLSKNSLNL